MIRVVFRTSSDRFCTYLKGVCGPVKPQLEFEDKSDVRSEVSLSLFISPFIIMVLLSTSLGSTAHISGALCCWCGVSADGEDDTLLLHGRVTLLSV